MDDTPNIYPDSPARLDALHAAMDDLDRDGSNNLVHSMLGSLSALVNDDQWEQALRTARALTGATLTN